MKLFGRIYAVTETDGNTEKQVRLPDRIFTFPPAEQTKSLQAAGSIFGGLRRSASQSSHISEGRGAKSIVLNQGLYYIKRP